MKTYIAVLFAISLTIFDSSPVIFGLTPDFVMLVIFSTLAITRFISNRESVKFNFVDFFSLKYFLLIFFWSIYLFFITLLNSPDYSIPNELILNNFVYYLSKSTLSIISLNYLVKENLFNKVMIFILLITTISALVGIAQKLNINFAYTLRELIPLPENYIYSYIYGSRPPGLSEFCLSLGWDILFVFNITLFYRKFLYGFFSSNILVNLIYLIGSIYTVVVGDLRLALVSLAFFFSFLYQKGNIGNLNLEKLNKNIGKKIFLLFSIFFLSLTLISNVPGLRYSFSELFQDDRFIQHLLVFREPINNILFGHGFISHHLIFSKSEFAFPLSDLPGIGTIGLHSFLLQAIWAGGLLITPIFLFYFFKLLGKSYIYLIPILIFGLLHNFQILNSNPIVIFTYYILAKYNYKSKRI